MILERFDEVSKHTQDASTPPPATNGHAKSEYIKDEGSQTPTSKREVDGSDEDEKPKKKRPKQDDDAKLAALLQAQEDSRTRSTRGGGTKRSAGVKKSKSTPKKKKSSAKVKATDDSDMELGSDGEPKEVVRKGGFHVRSCSIFKNVAQVTNLEQKQYNLSAALADLVGEPTVRVAV